jgi:cytochrome d ubiquinol oxidase subunit II
MAEVCLALALVGVAAYAVLGSADLGAGFWDLTAGGDRRGGRVRGMIQRSMSPVWEANHVWLIFVLVVLWTAFPTFFGSVFSTLYLPLTGAALGIIFRGAAFALRGQAATIGEARALGALFASASVLVPFCLGAAIGAIASGRVPVGNAAGDPWSSWLNPTSILIGALAVATGAYLAAVYLAGDAQRAGFDDLVDAFRRRALGAGVVAGALALGGLVVVHGDARHLYDGLTSGAGLACVLASAACGALTLALVWARRLGPARWTAAAAVALVVAGWAFAQRPDLLPGELTLDQAAAPEATLVALTASVAVGALVLVPSLVYLFRLVLRGTLDQELEPLDQRFQPLRAGDRPREEAR